jgi:hypothetical protein
VALDHLGIMSGGVVTPSSVVRPCGKGMPPRRALEVNKSLHLTIGYPHG